MDIVSTSLEALIQRATSPSNPGPDTAAIDAFCGLVNKEPKSAQTATCLITSRIQSPQEWEALQGLNVLEACMKRCGSSFHAEIGKFRFLNEMIKLVSPKYLGSKTPAPVRERVLQLMYSWTVDYPRETKIKEAYQMLRKQGVVTDDPPVDASASSGSGSGKSSVFEDEKKQRLLQKLLQSKNPTDLIAANKLIKTMVKEDERRSEIMSRRATELEAAHNNARLLSEMLDCYRPASSSNEDLDLIKELHQSCERFSVQISRDLQPEEVLFGEAMETIDELNQVFAKFKYVVLDGCVLPQQPVSSSSKTNTPEAGSAGASLLDLMTPSGDSPVTSVTEQLADLNMGVPSFGSDQPRLDGLNDLLAFSSEDPSATSLVPSSTTVLQPMPLNSTSVPTTVVTSQGKNKLPDEKPGAKKALEDLDVLGETLLKQNLPSTSRTGLQFNKVPVKVPMNLLERSSSTSSENGVTASVDTGSATTGISADNMRLPAALDLDFLIGNHVQPSNASVPKDSSFISADELLNGDDAMVDLSDDTFNVSPSPLSLSSLSYQTSENQIKLGMQNDEAVRARGTDKEITSPSTVQMPSSSTDELTKVKLTEPAKVMEVKPLKNKDDSLNESPSPLSLSSLSYLSSEDQRILRKQSEEAIRASSTVKANSNPSSVQMPHCSTDELTKMKLTEPAKVMEVKPLNDISVSLDSIKPGPIPPLTALDERNGISVVLHMAKDTPRPDVSVYVVSTISKNSSPLSNYVFQAVVPKTCKLRLLSASSSELPAHNPFLPPSAITQVMLVANPSKVSVNLKFMISYTMDDDTITEMGEVESLPMLS